MKKRRNKALYYHESFGFMILKKRSLIRLTFETKNLAKLVLTFPNVKASNDFLRKGVRYLGDL